MTGISRQFQHFGVNWYGRSEAVGTGQGSSQAASSSPQALLDRPDTELEMRVDVSDPTHDLELQVAGGSSREESSPQDEPREDIGRTQGQVSEPSGSSETTFAEMEVTGEEPQVVVARPVEEEYKEFRYMLVISSVFNCWKQLTVRNVSLVSDTGVHEIDRDVLRRGVCMDRMLTRRVEGASSSSAAEHPGQVMDQVLGSVRDDLAAAGDLLSRKAPEKSSSEEEAANELEMIVSM